MKTIRRNRKSLHWAAISTTILVISVGAYAGSRRTPTAGVCQVYSGTPYLNSAYQIQNDQVTASLICPIVSDTAVPTGNVNGLTVNGWNAVAGGVQAKACVLFAAGGGGDCGEPCTGQGVTCSVNDFAIWHTHPNDYPYVNVALGSGSNVWGITFTTP